MARLEQLSQQVLAVMAEIGQDYSKYQHHRGLFCRSGCGECCQHPGIEATVLEMLPLAFRLIEEQRADQVLSDLAERDDARCYFYQSHSEDRKQGQCSVYQQRPGICRFFGAAGTTGRAGEYQLSTCRNIKTDHPAAYAETLIALESDPPPLIRHGQEQIRQLDPELASNPMPLNQALATALEKALFEQYYQSAE
ncbi:YkgJ family cysteine cluster protein [Rheinheimera riviphila]|uniref:YkgJ family cysteine cluster protein n=1 Tax=Rheinheimera riviphila TaxID=1834037 RepID=A0A437R5E5_9GAMM|nr:YkgJ family cysteine cluster protein [Rheinheimera riviphila]RVU41955.1 YkgJ family cysteine cluster protein [Rheinheimera riviphila]